MAKKAPKSPLVEIVWLFLKLGTIAFGGPAAHIAMIEEETVKKRGWLTREHFLDLLAATNLVPGPNSTEMAIHVGFERGRWKGLILAGSSFILPAALITLIFAIIYRAYGQIPEVQAALYGIKSAVIAVIFGALWRLGKTAIKDIFRAVVALLVLIVYFKGVNEVLLMFLCGLVGILWYNRNRIGRIKTKIGSSVPMLVFFPFLLSRSLVWVDEPERLAKLGLFFLKVGSILFGGGYLLVTFLQQDLVDRWKWLTQQQLLDAIAVGQLTPGPVLSTATFIGYQLGGICGALISTFGIFFPSFVIIALINPWVSKLRSSKLASGFLDGINAAVVALMAAVTIQLARTTLLDIPTLVIMLAAAAALIYYRLNSAWIVIAAGLIGFGLQALGLSGIFPF